jgi:hypothetical protein
MRNDLLYTVRVVSNYEVEAPVLVHTGLPHIVLFVILLGMERRMEQIIHKKPQLLLKGPLHITGRVRQRLNRPYGPFAASLSWASIAWRRAGVYSSSADGSMGMMLMIPPETLNSSRSPGLMPARRLTLEGTTSCFLSLTTTVIAKFKAACNGRIAFLGRPAQGQAASNNWFAAIHRPP